MSRRLIVSLASVAGLCVVYAAYWWAVALIAERTMDDWVAQRRDDGWQVSHAAPELSGFPGAVRLSVAEPRIAIGDDDRVRRWEGPTLAATLLPWAPTEMRIDAPGRHLLTLRRGADPQTLAVDAGTLIASFPLFASAESQSLDVRAADLTLSADPLPDVEAIDRVDLNLSTARTPDAARGGGPTVPDQPKVAFRIELDGVRLRVAQQGFARRIDKARIAGALTGRIPGGPRDEALAKWRDAGGTLDFSAVELVWGDLAIRGDGTWALDRDLQPEGAMSARIQGLARLIDMRVEAGDIHPRTADMIKMVLRAVATRPANGAAAEVTLPITVQNRTASLGPLPLGKLPRINWWSCRAPGECVVSLE